MQLGEEKKVYCIKVDVVSKHRKKNVNPDKLNEVGGGT